MIKEIVQAVTIPVMAKVRIGHFVEAQVINSLRHAHASLPPSRVIQKGHSENSSPDRSPP
jgi:pyridoxal biosynthesis lyase PdxS